MPYRLALASVLCWMMAKAEANAPANESDESWRRGEWSGETYTAQTGLGSVRGRLIGEAGGLGFLGIRYGKGILGKGRWSVAEAAGQWHGTLEATSFPPGCLQSSERSDIFSVPRAGFSEDCLFLNVFTSKGLLESSVAQAPVMVWVHGGSFGKGSTYDYRSEGIVANFVAKGAVVVVVQYRLGLFGFLSTGDPHASGNWGLWDVVKALEWVQDNISDYGGDRDSVTLFGESAGAIIASLLSYAPVAQHLFHRLILQSGSAHHKTVLPGSREKAGRTLGLFAERLGCSAKSHMDLVRCLRELSAEELLSTHRELFEVAYGAEVPAGTGWGPLVDGYLIPDELHHLAHTLQLKPAIMGATNREMAYFLDPPAVLKNIRKYVKVLKRSTEDEATLAAFAAALNPTGQQGFVDYYKKGNATEKAIELLSDQWFVVPLIEEAVAKTKVASPVWLYSFDHVNPASYGGEDYPWTGCIHAWDLCLEFGVDLETFHFERTAEDERVAELMTSLWVHFARTGDPARTEALSGLQWPPFVSPDDSPTLHILPKPFVAKTFHQGKYELWSYGVESTKPPKTEL